MRLLALAIVVAAVAAVAVDGSYLDDTLARIEHITTYRMSTPCGGC